MFRKTYGLDKIYQNRDIFDQFDVQGSNVRD